MDSYHYENKSVKKYSRNRSKAEKNQSQSSKRNSRDTFDQVFVNPPMSTQSAAQKNNLSSSSSTSSQSSSSIVEKSPQKTQNKQKSSRRDSSNASEKSRDKIDTKTPPIENVVEFEETHGDIKLFLEENEIPQVFEQIVEKSPENGFGKTETTTNGHSSTKNGDLEGNSTKNITIELIETESNKTDLDNTESQVETQKQTEEIPKQNEEPNQIDLEAIHEDAIQNDAITEPSVPKASLFVERLRSPQYSKQDLSALIKPRRAIRKSINWNRSSIDGDILTDDYLDRAPSLKRKDSETPDGSFIKRFKFDLSNRFGSGDRTENETSLLTKLSPTRLWRNIRSAKKEIPDNGLAGVDETGCQFDSPKLTSYVDDNIKIGEDTAGCQELVLQRPEAKSWCSVM